MNCEGTQSDLGSQKDSQAAKVPQGHSLPLWDLMDDGCGASIIASLCEPASFLFLCFFVHVLENGCPGSAFLV